mmetsp:Transcript_32829/g.81572  ORF Transcript_32829/g.81572 Transcript_32829/m.81572 type:complete len:247 (+) Transcript_32829:35-775(+)
MNYSQVKSQTSRASYICKGGADDDQTQLQSIAKLLILAVARERLPHVGCGLGDGALRLVHAVGHHLLFEDGDLGLRQRACLHLLLQVLVLDLVAPLKAILVLLEHLVLLENSFFQLLHLRGREDGLGEARVDLIFGHVRADAVVCDCVDKGARGLVALEHRDRVPHADLRRAHHQQERGDAVLGQRRRACPLLHRIVRIRRTLHTHLDACARNPRDGTTVRHPQGQQRRLHECSAEAEQRREHDDE